MLTDPNRPVGTASQQEWAEVIRPRVAAEFDRVASAFRAEAPGEIAALLENIGLLEGMRGRNEPHLVSLMSEIRTHLADAVKEVR